ncbi:carbohydrate ABC transporter permease [Cohnella silvisoli]|uniref:Sugar ABC transporter permease n=1 Tax=Cohnella silvisoli TaxID=2873699 RepID=A0ABV1L4E4_9BACL|nr:sugar ABC transporter permease [Cohnella silvisoli]MCD9026189.1 sugar ABC transporter permease [Cohnella silvisoli]
MQSSLRKKLSTYKYVLIMLPGLIVWFVLSIWPHLEVFPQAFYKWNGYSPNKVFVGWQNFETFYRSSAFKDGLLNTVLYVLFLFVIQTVLSVFLAVVLKRNTRQNRFFRTFFFLPLVFSSVMVGLTWGYMFDPNLGMLNQIFSALGIKSLESFNWLGEPVRAIFCIVMVHIWANIGYPLTILTAALQTIPEDLYEVSEIEGATSMQQFRKVTLPLLMPALLRITLLTVVTGALAVDYILILGSSVGSANEFDTWAVKIYQGLLGSNLGLPSAIGVFLGAILFIVFLIQYVVTKKVEDSIH